MLVEPRKLDFCPNMHSTLLGPTEVHATFHFIYFRTHIYQSYSHLFTQKWNIRKITAHHLSTYVKLKQ